MISHHQLPSIPNAKLPAAYSVAKKALAECERIDECKDWADKAAALGSYAKQSKDESLFKMAARIQARAIRRCGELLKEFEPAKNQYDANAKEGDRPSSRKQAAEDAGLSEWQQKTVTRVANVPEEEFEAQVESENPPTVTALAEQGTQKKVFDPFDLMDSGIDFEDHKRATYVLGVGRNRRLACNALKRRIPDYVLLDGQDPVTYILSVNINRRHMTKGQRAVAVAKVCPFSGQTQRQLAESAGNGGS